VNLELRMVIKLGVIVVAAVSLVSTITHCWH
jgi:hypothetical protein